MAWRTDRDLARGRRAAALARERGCTALEAACAHIEATFSPAMHHSLLKDRVARIVAGGTTAPDVRTRYCRLAERYPRVSLDAALVLLARMRRAEHEARAAAIATWGYSSRPRVTLMVLDELRLILRMVRRYAREAWPGLLAATLDGEGYAGPAQAAE